MGTVEGKKQEKRRALLEAAYDLFLERGAAKTSVEDITSRAKVAKGTFYLYFQDKGAVRGWGSGQQNTSAAQGTKWTLGAATRGEPLCYSSLQREKPLPLP